MIWQDNMKVVMISSTLFMQYIFILNFISKR